MTTAEVFSNYLGLTPENAPWAFGDAACELCGGAGGWWTVAGDGAEQETQCPACYHGRVQGLTATSPLAPEPTPGWLEALVKWHAFLSLGYYSADYTAFVLDDVGRHINGVPATHPTHAVARALIASAPALREACERAGDYENYKETK